MEGKHRCCWTVEYVAQNLNWVIPLYLDILCCRLSRCGIMSMAE